MVKTRISIGSIPRGTPIFKALGDIVRRDGIQGLYAGMGYRILWSGLFGGVGFTSFEVMKSIFKVGTTTVRQTNDQSEIKSTSHSSRQI